MAWKFPYSQTDSAVPKSDTEVMIKKSRHGCFSFRGGTGFFGGVFVTAESFGGYCACTL
jgi:hypothetical protein